MEENSPTKTLLAHRRLTRTIGQFISKQMRELVSTLTPLFSTKVVLGHHIQGGDNQPVKGADQAFKDLQNLYETVATVAPFYLPKGLESPLIRMSSSLELTAWEYLHTAKSDHESKQISVTCPFKFILTYTGYAPSRLKELLNDRSRNNGELQQFVLHYLGMHLVVTKQPGLTRILDTLHFPLGFGNVPGFGALPITYIASPVSTSLPSDEIVLESTELSGKNAFEELINMSDITKLRDPLIDRLAGFRNGFDE